MEPLKSSPLRSLPTKSPSDRTLDLYFGLSFCWAADGRATRPKPKAETTSRQEAVRRARCITFSFRGRGAGREVMQNTLPPSAPAVNGKPGPGLAHGRPARVDCAPLCKRKESAMRRSMLVAV